MAPRARKTVTLERFTSDKFDPYGEPIPGYAPPETHRVYGWSPLTLEELNLIGRDRQVLTLNLWLPNSFPEVDRRDRITLPRLGRFEFDGGIQWWNDGPFHFKPGGTARIFQVEG